MKRALVFGIGLGVLGCGEAAGPAPGEAPSRASVKTPWVRVIDAASAAIDEAPAEVIARPDARAEIGCPAAGRVLAVHVARGDRLEIGAPVVDVVLPEVVEAMALRDAATVRLAALDGRIAKLEGLRAEGLARAGEITELRLSRAEAQGEARVADAKLVAAGLSGGGARVAPRGGGVTLTSPVAGVVTSLDAPLGGACGPGSGVLARVASAHGDRVEARLSGAVPAGARVSFVPVGGAPLALTSLGASPEIAGGVQRAWFGLPEGATLVPGTPGTVRVALDAGDEALIVPSRSIGLREGKAVVTRRRGGADVEVTVLATAGVRAVVRGDLIEGDEVAADAAAAEHEEASP